jgi:HSP20 family protein
MPRSELLRTSQGHTLWPVVSLLLPLKELMMSVLTPWRNRAVSAPLTSRPLGIASAPFSLLSREIDDLLSRFGESWDGDWPLAERNPSLDLSETNGNFEVKIDVPGMTAEEIDIEVTGDTLTITGKHEEEKAEEDKEKKYHRVERRCGSFQRRVALPCPVKDSEVTAEYQDGVITIQLPKTEEAKSHRVAIKS